MIDLRNILKANPFILAPLAGYTDLPFRLLCREFGAGLCYTEMVSSHGLVYSQGKTQQFLTTTAADHPLTVQLFGSDAAIMAAAAGILRDYPIDAIDINMGCPVRKVVRKGAGAALMKELALARDIMAAVVAASAVPVSIKIRSGWNHDTKNAPLLARIAADAGIAAVAVHGRTWTDGFTGTVDLDIIAAVKQAVAIPVMGNGDLHSRQDAMEMMARTGCDGVMIGRAALGAPWIFSETTPNSPELDTRLATAHQHLALVERYLRPYPFGRLKNHVSRYFKTVNHGVLYKKNIFAAKNIEELQSVLV